jgi:hypothetical protein
MSIPNNIMHFRKAKAQDLRQFGTLMDTYIGSNISSKISIAQTQLSNENFIPDFVDSNGGVVKGNSNYWGYSVNDIELPIETLRHIKPKGFSNATIYLDINLVSDFRDWDKINDPFCELSFKVRVKGTNLDYKDGIHYFGFHLDRHHESKPSSEIHPRYHFQYLQNPFDLDEDNFDFGSTLNLDTPRIMHYPLDLILGLDFLISNFLPSKYNNLINDRTYAKLIENYQLKIWKPYAHSLASRWSYTENQIVWDSKILCPTLL